MKNRNRLPIFLLISVLFLSCSGDDGEEFGSCTSNGLAFPVDSIVSPDSPCPIPEGLSGYNETAMKYIVNTAIGTWVANEQSLMEISCAVAGDAVIPVDSEEGASCLPWQYPVQIEIDDSLHYGVASIHSQILDDKPPSCFRLSWGFKEPYRIKDYNIVYPNTANIDLPSDETAWTLTVEENGEKIVYRKQED